MSLEAVTEGMISRFAFARDPRRGFGSVRQRHCGNGWQQPAVTGTTGREAEYA
jgi:hypothetical protein